LVEHLICNQGVGGSNPSGGTNDFNGLAPSPATTVSSMSHLCLVLRALAGVCSHKSASHQRPFLVLVFAKGQRDIRPGRIWVSTISGLDCRNRPSHCFRRYGIFWC